MAQNSVLSVLVIEDDPIVARQLTSFLAGLGWQVDFAASGKLAMRLCRKGRYDAVLLDTTLPDGCGLALCRSIKTECAYPVILMAVSEDVSARLSACNADDIVPDPSDYRDVVTRCQRVATTTSMAATA